MPHRKISTARACCPLLVSTLHSEPLSVCRPQSSTPASAAQRQYPSEPTPFPWLSSSLLCARACRTVGLIRPPLFHEGQADKHSSQDAEADSSRSNARPPLLSPCSPTLSTQTGGEGCAEVWAATPHPQHITHTVSHHLHLIATHGL